MNGSGQAKDPPELGRLVRKWNNIGNDREIIGRVSTGFTGSFTLNEADCARFSQFWYSSRSRYAIGQSAETSKGFEVVFAALKTHRM